MAIDPTAVDVMPAETIKLGHKASDDISEMEAREIAHKGKINPVSFALSHIGGAALGGALTLAGFGLTYMAVTGMLAGPLGFLAIPLTGALWYGGNAFFKAYAAANEHNQTIGEYLKEEFQSRGKQHEHHQGVSQPVVALPVGGDVGLFSAPQPEAQAAAPVEVHETPAARPAFLENILAQGSRGRLTPKELAAQIEAERASGHSHTV